MRIFLASTDAAWRILRQRQLQSLGQGSSSAYIWVHTVRTGKEKKFDCRLVTLGLVVDEQGFAKHSQLFSSSKSECGTLKGMIEAGGLAHEKKGMTVILDAWIATAKNGDGACGWIWVWLCHVQAGSRLGAVAKRSMRRQYSPKKPLIYAQ